MTRLLVWVPTLIAVALFIAWQRQTAWRELDLGLVRYPETAPLEKAMRHDWRDLRGETLYRLDYMHGEAAREDLRDDHRRLGQRLGYRRIDDQSFRWVMPPHCRGREWTCIYREVRKRSEIDLDPLLERLHAGFRSERFTTTRAAAWLLDFVQRIPYRVPTEDPFEVRPPALVASEDWGDCDSKSLLLISMLDRLGIDAVLLVSKAHAHAVVGIAVPTRGGTHRHRGREYAWAETTAENAPLGWLHPRFRSPDDWQVVRVR